MIALIFAKKRSKKNRHMARSKGVSYLGDALGSVHQGINDAQGIVNEQLTNAWGEDLRFSQGVLDRHGFTQRERDDESGVMHYRVRSYDPRVARFFQKEPLKVNRHYTYARNNPGMWIDPLGLDEWQFDDKRSGLNFLKSKAKLPPVGQRPPKELATAIMMTRKELEVAIKAKNHREALAAALRLLDAYDWGSLISIVGQPGLGKRHVIKGGKIDSSTELEMENYQIAQNWPVTSQKRCK